MTMTTIQLSSTGNARPGGPRIPFCERPVCSIADAAEATGLSRSKLYDLMKGGLIEWTKIGSRRLVVVSSLLRFLQADQAASCGPDDPHRPSERPSPLPRSNRRERHE
jgi:hypothetical protein